MFPCKFAERDGAVVQLDVSERKRHVWQVNDDAIRLFS